MLLPQGESEDSVAIVMVVHYQLAATQQAHHHHYKQHWDGWRVLVVVCVCVCVCVFVGCCLATKFLTLNNTKWNGWR